MDFSKEPYILTARLRRKRWLTESITTYLHVHLWVLSIMRFKEVVSDETEMPTWFMKIFGIESWMGFKFFILRRLRTGEMEIGFERGKIVGVKSRLSHMATFFCWRTINCCSNFTKEPKCWEMDNCWSRMVALISFTMVQGGPAWLTL